MNAMIQMVSEGKCGILVMLDLSAAFDTVVHEYLLSDLKVHWHRWECIQMV